MRTSKENQLQEFIIKFEGGNACLCVQCVCTRVHVHTHIWERARIKTNTGQEKVPTPGFGGDCMKGHNVATGLWAGRADLTAGLCLILKKSFQLSLLFSEWSSHWTGMRLKQKRDAKVFWKHLYKYKWALLPVYSSAVQRDFCLSNMPHEWNLFQSKAAFDKGRRDANNFAERQWFLISLLFSKQKKQKFSPTFCFSK